MSNSLRPHGLQPSRLLCPWWFSKQEHWRGLPFPSPGDLPNPGTEPRSPALWVDSLQTEPPGWWDIVSSSTKDIILITFKVVKYTHFPKLKYPVRNKYFASLKTTGLKCSNIYLRISGIILFFTHTHKITFSFLSLLLTRTANATITSTITKSIVIPNKSHNCTR